MCFSNGIPRPPFESNAEADSLRKQLKQQKNDFEKERAILQQKVELLSLEIKDMKEREYKNKQVQESMLSAFGTSQSETPTQKSHREWQAQIKV